MLQPIDKALNVAVRHMAAHVMPSGFDVTHDDDAPSSFEAVCARFNAGLRPLVWAGESERTIFGDPETNWAFRAWHDWSHWRYGLDFTLDGEILTCERQIADLSSVFYGHDRLTRWALLLQCEVAGQAIHFHKYGTFPVNQRGFAASWLLNGPKDTLATDWGR